MQILKSKGFKNILLIHRSWLARNKDYLEIQKLCASHFLLDKLSADDPFAIIAALHFGPGTYLVSNDLFRQYSTLLDNFRLKTLFMKWQYQHQVNHRLLGLANKESYRKVTMQSLSFMVRIRRMTLRIVGYNFSSQLTATLNLCPIYFKIT